MTEADTVGSDEVPREETVRVYEPGGRASLPPLQYLKALWGRRRLIVALARSELRAQHFYNAFGQLWLVLEPLLLASVYVVLIGIISGGATGGGRIQMIVSGMILFHFTRLAAQKGAGAVISNQGLLLNSSFPRAVLPVATTLEAFLGLLPGLAVYAVIHVATGEPIGEGLIAFPGLLALHAMFNFGMAMLIATLTVYFRDIQAMLRYLLRFWLYGTPVLYPVSDLRGNLDAVLAVLKWNPVWYLFDAYQRVFDGAFPTAWHWIVTAAWAVGALLLGFVVFMSKERAIAIRV